VNLLAVAVGGRGLVDPAEPVFGAGDEALLRGRAAFETARVYGGRPFRLAEHVARLGASAASLALPAPDSGECLRLAALVVAAGATPPDAGLRLYWTGTTLVATTAAIPDELEERRRRGLRLVALDLGVDLAPPGWLLPGVKSTSYAVNMAAEAEARRRGADDAVFLANGGFVLEAPISNVWWRRGGTLYTPALDAGVLAGVTRATVIELAPGVGFAVEEGTFSVDDLRAADEAFTSSSIREILPAVELDGAPIGDGAAGPAAAELQRALRELATGA
jgi:branched-subunit amino acid aminotransferase/4-amino-4-deoxychorismate lyase